MENRSDINKGNLSNLAKQTSRRYPWISFFVIIVLGGLIGYLIGFFLPPAYEAKATLTTNIDLQENRPVVTEIMVDSQLNYIGELMYNPVIVDPLLAQEASLGNILTLEDLKSNSSIERQLMSTIIIVRGNDPKISARIASNWVKIAFETLLEAKSHVLAVSEAKQELALIETCFSPNPDSGTDQAPLVNTKNYCEGLTFETAEAKLKELTTVLVNEETKTLGLMPYININQFIPASTPVTPKSTNQGMMSFSGMIIGLVIGIVFINLNWTKKIDEN